MSSCGDSSAEAHAPSFWSIAININVTQLQQFQFSPSNSRILGEKVEGSVACLRYPSGVTSSD